MPDNPSQDTAALLDRLATAIGDRVGASAVFGTPVTGDGVTVIPVARARFGFGGGGGGGPTPDGRGEGAGGGGGGTTRPIGFIELRGDRARFRRFPNPLGFVAGVLGLLLAAALLARILRRRGCGMCRRREDPAPEREGPGTAP